MLTRRGSFRLAFADVAAQQLTDNFTRPVAALLNRVTPARPLQNAGESTVDAAIRSDPAR